MSRRTCWWAPVLALGLMTGALHAQTPITQWTFNSTPPDSNTATGTFTPALGLGSASCYNVAPSQPLAECIFASGAGSSDVGADNTGWQTRGYQAQGVGPGTVGVEFAVSTVGFDQVIITWDQRHSNTSSRFCNLFYSTNGVTYTEAPSAPLMGDMGDTWFNQRTVDLSSIAGVSNNPNFQFRISPVFDPSNGVSYTASNASSTYASTGTYRFDMVTVSGNALVPIPPSGTAQASPGAVCAGGGQVTLSVNVVPGVNPPSTGITVTANLLAIGGSSAEPLIDQGSNTYSLLYSVPSGVGAGPATIPITIADAELRSRMISIPFAVADCSHNSVSQVVISQMYGGGGNSGPPQGIYDADFIELTNRSPQVVDLTNWSVQYAGPAAAGGFDGPTDRVQLFGIIRPGQHMLVRFSDPDTVGSPLPPADFIGHGGMGNNGGRVVLVRSSVLIGTDCAHPTIEDLAAYGGAICYEGAAPADPTQNDTAAVRKLSGAQDTDQNFNDFLVSPPSPRNRADGGFLAGYASISPMAICAGQTVTLSVNVFPGAAPPSTGIQVRADLSTLNGSASQLLNNAGGNLYTFDYAIPGAVGQGVKLIPISVADGQGRTDASQIALNVAQCIQSASRIVVSAFFGGGGNAGAPFDSDFIEVFNRSPSAVDLSGWSVQYADADNAPGFIASRVVPLAGSIDPGRYRLIRTSTGAAGVPIPTPDFAPAAPFGMDNAAGRIAVARVPTALGTNCSSTDIEDLVGYGPTALCLEGIGPTPAITNFVGGYRREQGCQDTNHNAIDFDVVQPIDFPRNSESPAHACPAPTTGACCMGVGCTVTTSAACIGARTRFSGAGTVCNLPGNNTTPCCRADFNQSGAVTPQDIFDFLAAFFTQGSLAADFNSSGAVTPQDIFDFLAAFFRSCP